MPHRTLPNVLELDAIAWKIIESLQHNARLSFAELGRKIGLSTPAVAERVRRLEEAGIITGYHAALDLAKLGVPIRVLVRLTIHGGDLQVSRTVTAIEGTSRRSAGAIRITGAEVVRHLGRCGVDPAHGGAHRQAVDAGRDIDFNSAVIARAASRLSRRTDRVIRPLSLR